MADEITPASTLPGAAGITSALDRAYARWRALDAGTVSQVYPALARVRPDLFGIALVDHAGELFDVGDAHVGFAVMSAVKPFTFALVAEHRGLRSLLEEVGTDATGQPYDAIEPIARDPRGRTNPMVNSGALAVASRVPGLGVEERWAWLLDGLSRFAGRPLDLDVEVYESAMSTNVRNREIAAALARAGALVGTADDAVDLYTRQSSLRVNAVDLARMGAVLARGGRRPGDDAPVVGDGCCRAALAAMATAGLYESTGRWLQEVGVPAKSGIGGGIVTVAPGRCAVGTYSPRLSTHGNSVRGGAVTADVARALGLDLFAATG